MMKRTFGVKLLPTDEQRKILRELHLRCARLWNRANYIIRQNFFRTGEILSYKQICNLMQSEPEYKALPTDIGQEVLKKLIEAWNSFKELKRLEKQRKLPNHFKRVSPPRYFKDRRLNQTLPMPVIPIKAPRSYSLGDYFFSLTVPKDLKGQHGIRNKLTILATYKIPYEEFKLGRAEIVKKSGKYYVHISAEIEKPQKVSGKNYASIDLGARNLITLAIYIEEEELIRVYQFKSRELWKEWKYWTKRIAKYQSKLAKSGHVGRTRGLNRLYEKRKKRLKVAIQGMANKVVKLLEIYGVKKVVIGDLTGIRERKDYGSKINKLLHNFWVRKQIEDILANKLEEAGIGIVPIPESNTSNTCFVCGSKVRRPKQHYLKCPNCGRLHSDTNGAINILKRWLRKKGIKWRRVREVHLVWRYGNTNRWIFKFLRTYKDKSLVREQANNPPVRVVSNSYSPKSSLAFSMRGG